jgi:hypothetical protein
VGQWLVFGWFWGWGTSGMQFAPVRIVALKYWIAVDWQKKRQEEEWEEEEEATGASQFLVGSCFFPLSFSHLRPNHHYLSVF